jgi:hypothetical protein
METSFTDASSHCDQYAAPDLYLEPFDIALNSFNDVAFQTSFVESEAAQDQEAAAKNALQPMQKNTDDQGQDDATQRDDVQNDFVQAIYQNDLARVRQHLQNPSVDVNAAQEEYKIELVPEENKKVGRSQKYLTRIPKLENYRLQFLIEPLNRRKPFFYFMKF